MARAYNNIIDKQEVYDYLMTKPGMTDIKAKGIMANIQAESEFYSDAKEPNVDNPGIGLFQHTYPSRKAAFKEAVPDWETNWKGQIDFAMQEQEMKGYMNHEPFDSTADSTEYFMKNFENPKDQSQAAIDGRAAHVDTLGITTSAPITIIEEPAGSYDDWTQLEPGDHENGDIIKVGDRHFEYQSNRATYAPHDIGTGETEDIRDGGGSLIEEWTVGTNPEKLPNGRPNPDYRKNRNEEGQYVYNSMDDVKKGKAKLKDGDELLVDGEVYKYDGETKDLISFSETGEIDEANNINVENIGVEPVVAEEITAEPVVAVEPAVETTTVTDDDEITDEEDEPIIEEEEEVQYQEVMGPNGELITIPIGEDVNEQDIEQELQAETTGEKVYESWDHVHNDPDLDRSEVIVIGENRYKWKVNEGGAEGSTTDGQYHIVDESGEFVPEENNEIQLIAQEPVIEATTTPEQTVLIGNERGEYSKNLNGEWIHTDPSTGTTTIVSDPITLETLEGTIEQPVVENEVVEEELDVDGSEIEDVSGNSDFKQKATKALKVMGSLGESVMTGASSLLDAVGGPGAIVSYLMGKESLKDAMKEVTPKQKANLSASFMEHLRQTKELQKRGFHPTEARAVQKEIDTAYQVGLEKSIRGTAGDRAKYLAQSGILDAKRSSALLEYSVKDAELQRTNQTKYTAMLNFKENFDAQRSEALRAEDMKAQQEKQKAASEFTGQMFKNVMSGLGGNKIGSFFQQNQAELTSFIDNITKNK